VTKWSPHILCDPSLLIPPDGDEPDISAAFWVRLIDWSRDRRLRLGPMTYDLVSAQYSERNWQAFDPPACPSELGRPGRRAIYQLLSRVLMVDEPAAVVLPTLSPSHQDTLVEEAIGNDCAVLNRASLVGIASEEASWSPADKVVSFDPPPPETLPLLTVPDQEVATEVDHRVADFFAGRRLTIVGGRISPQVVAVLDQRFGISDARWIEADGQKRLQLETLEGVRADRDIVVCVTGYIAHADSGKVQMTCRSRSVEAYLVERRREVVALIERVFGAA
jgi:hypothetical protein